MLCITLPCSVITGQAPSQPSAPPRVENLKDIEVFLNDLALFVGPDHGCPWYPTVAIINELNSSASLPVC